VTDAERVALARMVWCGFCWAAPGAPCTSRGQHLARYFRAYRRGLIGRDDTAAVCRSLSAVSAGQIVADDAPSALSPHNPAAPIGRTSPA
jgi:hypothetical protein